MRISIDLDEKSIHDLDALAKANLRTRKLQIEWFVKRGIEEKLLQ